MCLCRQLPAGHHVALLYFLVLLALDSNAVRDFSKDAHTQRDALTHERLELRKTIKAAERQAKEDAKAAAAAAQPKNAAAHPKNSAAQQKNSTQTQQQQSAASAGASMSGGSMSAAARVTRLAGVACDLAEKAEKDHARVVAIDEQLAQSALRHAPYLGSDRHRNEYWCISSCAQSVGAGDAGTRLCVLSQQYPRVRFLFHFFGGLAPKIRYPTSKYLSS